MTLDEMLKKSAEAVKAMTDEQREAMLQAQRKSWVRGEMGMGSDRDEAAYAKALREDDKLALAVLDGESLNRMRKVP